ncbi:MAG TPA: branched-chain amino acid ABC transporter permease [Pseudolabrys sp.]|nr:branched-chain amino acid ABC transporter permease [Pseudolabrys sp.]
MTIAEMVELLVAGLAIGCIYSLIALGLSIIIRATGVLNFAQGEVVMLGAMFGLATYRLVPLPFPVLFVAGALFAGVMAVIIEILIYRTLRVRRVPMVNIVISTIAMSILLQNGAQLVWGSEPIAYPRLFALDSLQLGPVRIAPQLAWIVVLALGMMLALQLFLRFTRAGLSVQAVAQDPEAAQLMGINLTRAVASTYGIAGILGGAAGVLLGSMFYASFNMGFLPGIKAFVAATLGGLGSIGGAMLGGVVFGLIETFTATSISTAYKDAVGMVLLIVILLVFPQGFAGAMRRGR